MVWICIGEDLLFYLFLIVGDGDVILFFCGLVFFFYGLVCMWL